MDKTILVYIYMYRIYRRHGIRITAKTGEQDLLPSLGQSMRGSREVDPGTAELGSQVVYVSGKQDGNGKEYSDADSSGLGLPRGGCSDDTIFTNNLDAFNVRARALVGVVNVHASLALSSNGVNVVAQIVQLGVSIIVGSSAPQTDLRDHGSVTERKGEPHGEVKGILSILGERSAGVVSEHTEVDLSTLISAVGSEVVVSVIGVIVGGILIVPVIVPVVGLVQTTSTTQIDLYALSVIRVIEELTRQGKLAVSVACIHSHICVTLGHALFVGCVVVIIACLGASVLSSVTVGIVSDGRQIRSNKGVHVNNVVSVLASAAGGVGIAIADRAQTEANEALGLDAHIIFLINFRVPLLDVVASLELDGVSSEKTEVHVVVVVFLFLFVVFVLVHTTSLAQQMASHIRVHWDISIELVDNTGMVSGMVSRGTAEDEGQCCERKTAPHGQD
jgi:hypothetical protein